MNIKLVVLPLLCVGLLCLICYIYIGNELSFISFKFNSQNLIIGNIVAKYVAPSIHQFQVGSVVDMNYSISIAHPNISNKHQNISFNTSLQSSIKDWMKKMEEKYEKINERIHKVCEEYRTKNPSEFGSNDTYIQRNIIKNMMVDVKHRLAYCRNGKVKYLFLFGFSVNNYIKKISSINIPQCAIVYIILY